VDTLMPVGRLSGDEVRSVLTAAIAAPSLHNSQPWRFRCTQNAVELFADPARALPVADPDRRELLLACGAALLNLRLAIRALGVYPDARLFPDPAQPDLVASVRAQGAHHPTPLEKDLARAIAHRHTNRRPFTDAVIAEPIRNQLRRAADTERSWLAILSTTQLPAVRALARAAHQTQWNNPAFRAEWTYWTARADTSADGVPARAAGPLPEPHDEWVLRDFSAGSARPRVPGKDFEPSPLIAVVGSFFDSPLAQLRAGQALQRILLTATVAGLSASFVSQIVEVAPTRQQLRELIGGGLWPQTLLRLGYGTPLPRTPRRRLEDILEPA
jgi:nitroreductase